MNKNYIQYVFFRTPPTHSPRKYPKRTGLSLYDLDSCQADCIILYCLLLEHREAITNLYISFTVGTDTESCREWGVRLHLPTTVNNRIRTCSNLDSDPTKALGSTSLVYIQLARRGVIESCGFGYI